MRTSSAEALCGRHGVGGSGTKPYRHRVGPREVLVSFVDAVPMELYDRSLPCSKMLLFDVSKFQDESAVIGLLSAGGSTVKTPANLGRSRFLIPTSNSSSVPMS